MTYRIRFTEEARADIERLYAFVLERSDGDWTPAERAVDAIEAAMELLATAPFAGRKVGQDPLRRELLIGFGHTGYVALYEIEDGATVTVLAMRHQREDDYY